MNRLGLRIVLLWSITLLCGAAATYAASMPSAPTNLTVGYTDTFNPDNYAPVGVNAWAGNITWLNIKGIAQTKAWQGYYGNISGTITLDDANNFTFYNWTNAHPRGQVYATLNTSISWMQVQCFDYSNSNMNWATINNYYNIATDNADGVNKTFNATYNVTVGSRFLQDCPATYIYQNDTQQSENFPNLLLWDITNNNTGWIYTAVIENKTAGSTDGMTCYNGQPCDFQMLVNEDGHGTDTNPTMYYFWVELL